MEQANGEIEPQPSANSRVRFVFKISTIVIHMADGFDPKLYDIKADSKGLAKSPWPMRGQNPQHTGRAPEKE